MDQSYFQSPSGTVYEYLYENAEDSHFVEPSSNIGLEQNPHIAYYSSFQNQLPLQQVNVHAVDSSAKRKLGYGEIQREPVREVIRNVVAEVSVPETLNENKSDENVKKKKKKNEKERLCHIVHRDLLLEAERHLLKLIFDNPPIWNHNLEIKERHPQAKATTWIQIHKKMITFLKDLSSDCSTKVNTVKLDTLKNTSGSIRENYVRYKNETQQPSGSGAKDVEDPDHVELMRTYDSMIAKRKQVSSIPDDESDETNKSSEKVYYTPQNRRSNNKKKDDSELSPFLATATTFLQKITDDTKVSKVPPTNGRVDAQENGTGTYDRCELFANSIIPDLKKLDYEHFALIRMIITKEIYEVFIKQKE